MFRRPVTAELTAEDKELVPLIIRALAFVYSNPGQRLVTVRPLLSLPLLQLYDRLISTIKDGLELNPNCSDKDQYLNDLATLFEKKYAETQSIDDLNAAIKALQDQIRLVKPSGPNAELALLFKRLDDLLTVQLTATNMLETADAIVNLANEGLEFFPEPFRPHYLVTLGRALRLRFNRTGSKADLDTAVKSLKDAFSSIREDDPSEAQAVYGENLGHALHDRYILTNDIDDLYALTEVRERVLAVSPVGHPNRAAALNHISLVYLAQYTVTKELSKLQAGIDALNEALGLVSESDKDRPTMLCNLGCCFQERYNGTGSRPDLDASIKAFTNAAELAEFVDNNKIAYKHNMETVLLARYSHTNSRDDLITAVNSMAQTVETLPTDHPMRLRVLFNLGTAYMAVAQIMEGKEALEFCDLAIQAFVDSAQLPDESSEVQAMRLNNLAAALMKRYEMNDSASDFAAAVTGIQESIKLTARDGLDSSVRLNTLARIYYRQFGKTNDLNMINLAIKIAKEAVETCTDMSRGEHFILLGQSLGKRFKLNDSADDLAAAIDAFSESIACADAPAVVRIHAAIEGARLAPSKYHHKAYEMLSKATDLLCIASPRAFHRHDQQYTLSGFRGLASDAAALCIRCGHFSEEALRLLEIGRGVMITSQLDTRSDITDLEENHPQLALKFKHLRDSCHERHSIHTTSFASDRDYSSSVPEVAKRYQVFEEFDELVQEIRKQKGFERFLLGPTLTEMKVLASASPLIYLNSSRFGSDAFIIAGHGVKHLSLERLSYEALEKNATILTQTLKDDSLRTRKQSNKALRAILEWLWDAAIEQILQELGFISTPESEDAWPHVYWIPVGLLNLFPLHAAGYATLDGRTALDRVVSSYIPTVKALQYAKDRATKLERQREQVSLLVVAMPTTPERSSLPFATHEIEAIGNILPGQISRTILKNPTRSAVLSKMQHISIAHFSCHGLVSADPSESQILLEDWPSHPFSVEDITRLKLDRGRLAYLSACHSASNISFQLLDEALHLAGACQLAGFPTVIGTLWQVDDMVSADVAESFYSALTPRDGVEFKFERSARALHFAIRKVVDGKRKAKRDDPMLWAAHIHVGV